MRLAKLSVCSILYQQCEMKRRTQCLLNNSMLCPCYSLQMLCSLVISRWFVVACRPAITFWLEPIVGHASSWGPRASSAPIGNPRTACLNRWSHLWWLRVPVNSQCWAQDNVEVLIKQEMSLSNFWYHNIRFCVRHDSQGCQWRRHRYPWCGTSEYYQIEGAVTDGFRQFCLLQEARTGDYEIIVDQLTTRNCWSHAARCSVCPACGLCPWRTSALHPTQRWAASCRR